MSEITSIEPQKKDKTRCSVFIDGRFYCGIKLEVAVKYRLREGMQIEREELDKIQLETEKASALDKALTHISATMKTQKQVFDFLEKKGYTPAVREYVTEKLKEYGYVNDAEYCRAYINSVKGKGKRALYADLLKRGADKNAIDAALTDMEESSSEATEILKKYLRGKELSKESILKGVKYLVSRGYGYDTARDAAKEFADVEDY